MACRVDPFTGKLCKEGWWKNESQKSLARSVYEFGWQLEPNALFRVPPNPRFEKVEVGTPYGKKEISRPCVEQRGQGKDAPSIRCYAAKAERRTGVKSGQRILQEVLRDFVTEHEEDFPKWKCGDFHRELAHLGVTCERVQHGSQYGLTFSLDGENYESATSTCPQLSYKKLLEKLSAKSWRDARSEHLEIAKSVRDQYEPQPLEQLMPAERQKVVYNKAIIDQMRKIPTADVWKAFGVEPRETNRSGRKIVNAFDVCMARGLSFSESTDFLASHFPSFLTDQDTSIDVDGMLAGVKAAGVEIDPQNMGRAREIARTMGALRADKLNLNVKSAQNKSHLLSPQYLEQSLSDICKKLDILASPETEIWASPVYEKGKRAIIVSSVKRDLDMNFPNPNLRLSGEKEQAVYVLDKKSQYDEFYDYLQERLNKRFGDPAAPAMIPVPGLSGKAKIVSVSKNENTELKKYARTVYEQWHSGADEDVRLPELENDSLYASRKAQELEDDLREEALRERDRLVDEFYRKAFERKENAIAARIARYERTIMFIKIRIEKPRELKQIEWREALLRWRAEKAERTSSSHETANLGQAIANSLDEIFKNLELSIEGIFLEIEKRIALKEAQPGLDAQKNRLEKINSLMETAQGKLDETKRLTQNAIITISQARLIDIAVARKLYQAGAKPDGVYSFMRENAQSGYYMTDKKAFEKRAAG